MHLKNQRKASAATLQSLRLAKDLLHPIALLPIQRDVIKLPMPASATTTQLPFLILFNTSYTVTAFAVFAFHTTAPDVITYHFTHRHNTTTAYEAIIHSIR